MGSYKLDDNWRKKPIFVVGEATSRLITNELDLKPVGAETGNAMALIPIILKCTIKFIILRKKVTNIIKLKYYFILFLDEINKPLLTPCGNLNLNILADNIKTIKFENIEIYRTKPKSNLKDYLNMALNQIKNQIGAIFFSPSGFHAILNLMPKHLFSQIHVSIKYIC